MENQPPNNENDQGNGLPPEADDGEDAKMLDPLPADIAQAAKRGKGARSGGEDERVLEEEQLRWQRMAQDDSVFTALTEREIRDLPKNDKGAYYEFPDGRIEIDALRTDDDCTGVVFVDVSSIDGLTMKRPRLVYPSIALASKMVGKVRREGFVWHAYVVQATYNDGEVAYSRGFWSQNGYRLGERLVGFNNRSYVGV